VTHVIHCQNTQDEAIYIIQSWKSGAQPGIC